MKIRIQHRTTYTYKDPVSFGEHKIMVRPREGHDVHIESSILEITPRHTTRWMRDVNGNSIAKIDFTEKSAKLSFYSEVVLNQYDTNPLDFILDESAVLYPFVYDPESLPELTAFMTILYPRATSRLRDWQTQFYRPGDKIETVQLLQKINTTINKTFRYERRDAPGVQTPDVTLRAMSGSCRDFATLMLESCRCWGLAARFVSGYMQCEATEAGGASTHAWVEVYLPGAGWKGFDPTSGIMTGAQHVTVAVSRNPENAAPIAGSFEGPINAALGIQVDVTVVEVGGAPKPAPPVPPLNSLPNNNPLPTHQQNPSSIAQTQSFVQNQSTLPNNPPQLVQQAQQAQQQIAANAIMDMVIDPKKTGRIVLSNL